LSHPCAAGYGSERSFGRNAKNAKSITTGKFVSH
jgi:hypothetical protein